MAAQGLLLLGVELLEVRMFRRRVMVVEPEMVEVYTSCGIAHNLLFDDLRDQPRAVQKNAGATPHALRAAEDTPCKR
jgi:hypothetical protein